MSLTIDNVRPVCLSVVLDPAPHCRIIRSRPIVEPQPLPLPPRDGDE